MQNGLTVACRGINVGIRSRPLVRADAPPDATRNSTLNWHSRIERPGGTQARRVAHENPVSFLSFLFPSSFSRHAILAGVHPSALEPSFQPLFKQSSGKQWRVTRREGDARVESVRYQRGGRESRRTVKRKPSNGISIYSWRLIFSSLLFPPRERKRKRDRVQ